MILPSPAKHPTGPSTPARFTPVPDARPDDTAWPPLAWPPASDVLLVGEHVRLMTLNPERHAAELFQALDDDATWQHLSHRPRTADDYAASLAESLTGPLAPGPHGGRWRWAVQLTKPFGPFAADALVGTTSFLDVSPSGGRLEIGSTAYARPCWGSAVNPETKLLLLSYAFDELGAGRVQIKTDARNSRSQQAIARLGATYEGTLRRHQRRADGSIRDTVMFSIIIEDWPAVRDGLQRRLDA
ncbi:GNAT family N-acetyltransferase [Leifsonia sp. YAF41]|uniref:GNAT family N-acetyltransferase n=1 Tax=Leifsonia sp. YAF41 TaxID=3233086 RepID=UPI003F98C713